MVSCEVTSALFIGAVTCAILGNVATAIAWRGRRSGLGPWHWLVDPLALLRSTNFSEPRAPARLVALGLLVAGAIGLVALATILIRLQRGGATAVCGFSF